jgi:PAS domain S-box-containing protein
MKIEILKQKISLSRRIFQYLTEVTLFSLILMGSFWIRGKVEDYNKEITLLKKTYAEIKKTEIKNKILQIKDYIYWVLNNPTLPLSNIITTNAHKLESGILNNKTTVRKLPQAFKDSVGKLQVPVFVLNNNGDICYSYNPFTHSKVCSINEEVKALRNQLKKIKSTERGTIQLYKQLNVNDSILTAIGFFDHTIVSGFTVALLLNAEHFEDLLQEHILDSLSRIRFTKDEYIFINTSKGEALVTNGKYNNPPIDILASDNAAWKSIYKIQRASANQAGGLFYTYIWPKISTSKTAEKTSFFSYLPEWNWIMGTGFYKDDVNLLIESKRHELYVDMQRDLLNIAVFLIITLILGYLIVLIFTKRLEKNINLFKNFFEQATVRSILIEQSQVNFREFEDMANAANLMIKEREKTKIALHKSEEKFLIAFKNSPDAITITSMDEGYIIDANESISRITGYSLKEIIGYTSIELNFWVNFEDRNRYVALIKNFGRFENFEADLRMKSGEIRSGLFSGEIILLDNEKHFECNTRYYWAQKS